MNNPMSRRTFLSRMSLALMGLAAAVVNVPILGYLFSPLLQPAPQRWLDLGPIDDYTVGQTTAKAIPEVSPLPWAGQTAQTAVWVRRSGLQDFIVFAVNCTHLGCPVNWRPEANIFLCPCHGGVFYADGSVAGGPPPHALFRYENRIENGRLQVRSRELPLIGG